MVGPQAPLRPDCMITVSRTARRRHVNQIHTDVLFLSSPTVTMVRYLHLKAGLCAFFRVFHVIYDFVSSLVAHL